MWNFYNEQLEVSRKDAKDAKGNVFGTEKIWRGLGLGRRAGIASRNSELIWAGIPYCVLHTCLRSVAPMELFLRVVAKIIFRAWYGLGTRKEQRKVRRRLGEELLFIRVFVVIVFFCYSYCFL